MGGVKKVTLPFTGIPKLLRSLHVGKIVWTRKFAVHLLNDPYNDTL